MANGVVKAINKMIEAINDVADHVPGIDDSLIPTVPDIASQVGGASIMQIITAIVCSATVAGISPLSTGGSLILASYAQETDCSDKEQQKMFGTLFALSATVVVIVCVLTFIGVTSFVG